MASAVILRGPLPLIDAPIIRFLQALAQQHGPLCVAPERAVLAPTVELDDLRYLLARLSCVVGVLEAVPPDAPCLDFPTDTVERQARDLAHRAPLDEPLPDSCSLADLRADRPNPVVLLTGCFDLIHVGHVRLIEAACAYGAEPVVAILTSRGIAAQPKNGGDRPLWNMADRVSFLRALRLPIRILLFDGPDSRELIRTLRPDFWVKEERDRQRRIVEEEGKLVQSLGGCVVWASVGLSRSSTEIAQAVRTLGTGNGRPPGSAGEAVEV